MDTAEFENLWTLMANLFPASPKLKKRNMKRVWEIAVNPYALGDVTDAVMHYARSNKFFPDVADITAGLPAPVPSAPQERGREDLSWMLAYIQREAAHYSADHAEAYHSAGVQTWQEARESGMKWPDWVAGCRSAFSTPGHKQIFPEEA